LSYQQIGVFQRGAIDSLAKDFCDFRTDTTVLFNKIRKVKRGEAYNCSFQRLL